MFVAVFRRFHLRLFTWLPYGERALLADDFFNSPFSRWFRDREKKVFRGHR